MDITDYEFNKIAELMYQKTGVKLRSTKKNLVILRLKSRLEFLGITNFYQYISRLNNDDFSHIELEYFINAITTNETYFFRTQNQFDYLANKILPDLIELKRKTSDRVIKIWSAACSIGCEPYSIAILLKQKFSHIKDVKFVIYASDINSVVLKKARQGVYSNFAFRGLSETFKRQYFKVIRSSNNLEDLYELDASIKDMVFFKHHNLKEAFPYKNIDIIFMRNVMIYFDKQAKQEVIRLLEKVVSPSNYLAISLSETLSDIETNFDMDNFGYYRMLTKKPSNKIKLMALVSSTGGINAAYDIIPKFPIDMVPIVWVQHMPPGGFTASFAERLNSISEVCVKEAEQGEELKQGVCYIAPGGLQMRVQSVHGKYKINLSKEDKLWGCAPSADILFNSLAELCLDNIIGVVMTGMGKDGVQGLERLHANGAYIIGQNEESSVVYGMAREAKERGIVDMELDVQDIAKHIIKKINK